MHSGAESSVLSCQSCFHDLVHPSAAFLPSRGFAVWPVILTNSQSTGSSSLASDGICSSTSCTIFLDRSTTLDLC